MRGKKPPPSHRLLSYAEILNIKAEAKRQGIMEAWIIFFSTLRDKEGFGPKRLRRVLTGINQYADSIRGGYITIQDLQNTLKEEAGIELSFHDASDRAGTG